MLTSIEHVSFMLLAFITYYDVCELDKYHYIDFGHLQHIFLMQITRGSIIALDHAASISYN
jgi:hypothetical protein